DADGALHGDGAGFEKSEEEPRRQHGERVEATEQGDGDRVEAEAVSEAVDQAIVDAEDFDGAGQSGEPAREHHDRYECSSRRDPGVRGGGGAGAEDAEPKAERRAPERNVSDDD